MREWMIWFGSGWRVGLVCPPMDMDVGAGFRLGICLDMCVSTRTSTGSLKIIMINSDKNKAEST